jgi:hypothetical protein
MSGPGNVYIKHGDVYGAIVSGTLTLGQNGAVHFDYALQNSRFPLAPTISRLEYLYVSNRSIHVANSASSAPPMVVAPGIASLESILNPRVSPAFTPNLGHFQHGW